MYMLELRQTNQSRGNPNLNNLNKTTSSYSGKSFAAERDDGEIAIYKKEVQMN